MDAGTAAAVITLLSLVISPSLSLSLLSSSLPAASETSAAGPRPAGLDLPQRCREAAGVKHVPALHAGAPVAAQAPARRALGPAAHLGENIGVRVDTKMIKNK